MLCVHGHYKYFYSFGAAIDFRRQNQTSTDYCDSLMIICSTSSIHRPTSYMDVYYEYSHGLRKGVFPYLC